MEITELKNLTFDEAIEIFLEEDNCVITKETLINFVIERINEDDFWTAADILCDIRNDKGADYFHYDLSMSSYSRAKAIYDNKDLEYLCEDYHEYYTKLCEERMRACGFSDTAEI